MIYFIVILLLLIIYMPIARAVCKEPDWVKNWVRFHDGMWYHYQPDNTCFGPFATRRRAVKDCIKQARNYT